MVASPVPANASLSGLRKAAMFMVLVGESAGAELLKALSNDEVQLISREIARVSQITNTEADLVLEEFNQMALARDYVVKGGIDYARKMLLTAFGPESSKKLIDDVVRSSAHDTADINTLHEADPQQLAKFVNQEHPQTIALILSHLIPTQAAALLVSLPSEIRSDVALRMANLDQISPDVINKIAGVIGQKPQLFGEFRRESYDGIKAVTELFNRLDSARCKEILDGIGVQNPALVERLRQLMFVFEDLISIDIAGMKELTNRIDRKILTLALKGTSEKLRAHFLQCLSARGAEMMKEDMESMGPVKMREVEAAQQQIIALIRQMEADGVINIKGTVGEQYVV